jgi:tryptophan-rich sensory protein
MKPAFRRLHIAVARRDLQPSALLFAPYAAWVAFATVLNASIVYRN